MEAVQQWGIYLILTLQELGSGLDVPMRFFTSLGQEGFFLVLIPLLYWCVDSGMGMQLTFLLVLSNQVNAWLKWLFHEPRPYWLNFELLRETEMNYGVPSGHAQNAVVVWGLLASRVQRLWAWPVAVALVLLISLSRLYLGVHFPHDILVGWLIGALCLWLFLGTAPRAWEWLSKQSVCVLVCVSIITAAALAAIPAVILAAIAGVQDPPEWASFAADARDSSAVAAAAGMLFGGMLGFGLQERFIRFDTRGPGWKRLVRFVTGFVGVAVVFLGLRAVLHESDNLAGHALRFLRYFLSIFWVAYAAPLVFVKARLAEVRS